MLRTSLFLACISASRTLAESYSLTDTFSGSTFFDNFDFFTGGDPTDGWVQYVDYGTAVSKGIINPALPSWGVDHSTVLDPSSATGRASVRLSSKKTWTHGLFVADIAHMPDSTCGLWPAFWTLGQTGTWPYSGEIDIIEGVNNGNTNLISGHTANNCTIAGSGESGTLLTDNCAVSYSTTGCGTSDTNPTSYGTGFNNAGGGVYAMEWTSSAIKIWHFGRSNIPSGLSYGSPDPSTFGTPTAVLAGGCDIDTHWFNHAIIFDTTFCGTWAGNTFESQGCPMTSGQDSWPSCVTYVAENPSAFANAYWQINSIKVFQASGVAAEAEQNLTSSVVPVASTASLSLTSATIAMGASNTLASTASSVFVPSTASSVASSSTAEASTMADTASVFVSVPASTSNSSTNQVTSPATTQTSTSLSSATQAPASTTTTEARSKHRHGHSTHTHAKLHKRFAPTDAATQRRARRRA